MYAIGRSPEALSAPITFNTALPVADGEFIFRELLVVGNSDNDQNDMNLDLSVLSTVSVLGYGVNNKLAAFAVLPYIYKELDIIGAGQDQKRNTNDIGDLTLFSRYTIFQDDSPGRTFRIAPITGIKTPTGKDGERDTLGRLPISLQPGSGAWDAFAGLVATLQTLNYQIDGQVNYRINGEANNFEAGDELRVETSLQYRLWPRIINGGVPGFLYGVLELGFFNKDNNQIDNIDDVNSGGKTLFVTPGLQYVTRRWIMEAAVQIPLAQDLNGASLESNYIVHAGFRFNF